MAYREDLPYIVIERRSGGVAPFLWGALAGAAVALLYAPRSGRETQEELLEGAQRLRLAAEERVGEVRDAATDVVDDVRQRVQERVDTVRDAIDSRVEGVRQAMNAGRQAARETREDLEQRVAAAKEAAILEPDVDTELDTLTVTPPTADVVVTEVVVEEEPPRPNFG